MNEHCRSDVHPASKSRRRKDQPPGSLAGPGRRRRTGGLLPRLHAGRLALLLAFTELFPFVAYRSATSPKQAATLLAPLLPSQLPGHAITGFPVWGGAFSLVLGAVCWGSEFGWGTLKTMLSNRPGRTTCFMARDSQAQEDKSSPLPGRRQGPAPFSRWRAAMDGRSRSCGIAGVVLVPARAQLLHGIQKVRVRIPSGPSDSRFLSL